MWMQMDTEMDLALPVEEHHPDNDHLERQIFSEDDTQFGPFSLITSEKICFMVDLLS